MIDVVGTFKVNSSVVFIFNLNFEQTNKTWLTGLMQDLEIVCLQLLHNNKQESAASSLLRKAHKQVDSLKASAPAVREICLNN